MSDLLTRRVQDRVRALLAVAPVQGPFMDPCQCGRPRHEHAGDNHTGRHLPTVDPATGDTIQTGCKKWRKDLVEETAREVAAAHARNPVDVFREWDRAEHRKTAQPREAGQLSIGASDAGTCKRALWYRNFPPADYTPEWTDDRAALMGTALHFAFLGAEVAMYPWRWIETAVSVPGFDRKVRIDSYDPYTGVITDLKFSGTNKWRMLGNDGPTEGTKKQLRIYGLAMSRAGHLVTALRLPYINRENGHFEAFEEAYDEALALEAVEELATIGDLLAAGVVPDREGDGPTGFPCGWCPARVHCWNMEKAAEAGRGPVSLTILGSSPEDGTEADQEYLSVVWAAKEYIRGRDIEKSGTKVKDYAREMLDGIEPGRYGDVMYVNETQWRKNPSRYIAELEAELVKAATERRPVDEVLALGEKKYPQTTVTVRPVRKATLEKEAKARAKVEAVVAATKADADAAAAAGSDVA